MKGRWLPVAAVSFAVWFGHAAGAEDAYTQAVQAELDKLRQYVTDVGQRVVQLQQLLIESEQRNRSQAQLIDSLERQLRERQQLEPQYQQRVRRAFFDGLATRLPASPVYRVEKDRLVVAADPVFVFGTGEIGAEGESRLHRLLDGLRQAAAALPAGLEWRLRVEGHSDQRPLRNNARFPSNWELSTARAVSLLRFLQRSGVADGRLYAAGFAATQPVARGDGKAAHRRNRRIELHLEFPGQP
jgi:chemotaxis protein MotB